MTINRWYVRTAILSSLLGAGSVSYAADAKGGAPAPAAANPPARGGGNAGGGARGGEAAPPAAPNPAPADRGGATPRAPAPAQPRPATPRPGRSDDNPGARDNFANPPSRTPTPDGAKQPVVRDGGDRERRDGRRDGDRNRRTVFVTPLQTWAPYTWWYSGNSYWWPPMDDYGDYRADDATTPADNQTPVERPSPAVDQAKAANELEGTPGYARLAAEVRKVQSAYDTASARVLEKLKGDPEYQALVKERDRAEERVEAVQAGARVPSPEKVTPAAQRKLEISARITRMEQNALAADPQASRAKARLVELTEELKAARRQAEQAGTRVPQ